AFYVFIQGKGVGILAILEISGCLGVVPHHHVQDYPVIDRVLVMSMSLPITGFNMNFYIPFY
ncbi:MAG: hypothetical protein QQN63_11510, partial [Nitrosopumilus sp.]